MKEEVILMTDFFKLDLSSPSDNFESHPDYDGIVDYIKRTGGDIAGRLFSQELITWGDLTITEDFEYLDHLTYLFKSLRIRIIVKSMLLSECEAWFFFRGRHYSTQAYLDHDPFSTDKALDIIGQDEKVPKP